MILLGRVADAFDGPTTRERQKDLRVCAIKTHRPQASHSSCNAPSPEYNANCPTHPARCICDIDCSSRLHQYPSETISGVPRIPDITQPRSPYNDQANSTQLMTMLLDYSPLDRLNYFARTELKKAGWFDRSDKWSVVKLGLSPSKPSAPQISPLLIPESPSGLEGPLPDIQPIVEASEHDVLPEGATRGPPFAPEMKLPNDKIIEFEGDDDDDDTSASNTTFPDYSYLPYNKPLPLPPARHFGGRMKSFVKRVFTSSGAGAALTTVRNRHSLLVRTPLPHPQGSPMGWSYPGMNLTSPAWILACFCCGIIVMRSSLIKPLWLPNQP